MLNNMTRRRAKPTGKAMAGLVVDDDDNDMFSIDDQYHPDGCV